MGASCAGTARPLLEAALESSDRVRGKLELMRDEFKAAMFLTGSRKVADLSKKEFVVTGATRNWLLQTME